MIMIAVYFHIWWAFRLYAVLVCCCWFGADFLMINKWNGFYWWRLCGCVLFHMAQFICNCVRKERRRSSARARLDLDHERRWMLVDSKWINSPLYKIIIYIDDDMMSHPVFFNQINYCVCITQRVAIYGEREKKTSRQYINWSHSMA